MKRSPPPKRPRKLHMRDFPPGSFVRLSYGPLPQDKASVYEVTEHVHLDNKRGYGGYISTRRFGDTGRGVGCPASRVWEVLSRERAVYLNEYFGVWRRFYNGLTNPYSAGWEEASAELARRYPTQTPP